MSRLAATALAIAATLALAAPVLAAPADDESSILRDAISALKAELDVVEQLPPGEVPPGELRGQLIAADQLGVTVLGRAKAAGITLSTQVNFVLSRLPQPGQGQPRTPSDYTVAISMMQVRLDDPDATRVAADTAAPGPTIPVTIEPAANSSDEVVTDETLNPASESTGLGLSTWIALGRSSFAAIFLGIFALRRTRQAEGFADMAMTDGLTGLNNRRKFDDDVDARARCGVAPVAMLMVDVDHFKDFNDMYGHTVGDDVLRLVGTALSASVRKQDVAYRYGGEEFAVLLPDTSAADAVHIAERVRTAISQIELPVRGNVTASIGVSTGPSVDVIDLIESADAAMYEAKAGGRNRVSSG